MFDTVTKVVFGGLAFFIGFLFFACFTTIIGALLGWVVGLVFGPTILHIAGLLGIKGVAMWELGAFLGFVGSFFRSSQVNAGS